MWFMYLELYLLAFLCGVASGSLGVFFGIAVLSGAACWMMIFAKERFLGGGGVTLRWLHVVSAVFIVMLCFWLGYARFSWDYGHKVRFGHVLEQASHGVIHGVAISDPMEMQGQQGVSVSLRVERIEAAYGSVPVEGVVRAMLPAYPEVWRGQRLTVEGKVKYLEKGDQWMLSNARALTIADPRGVSGAVFRVRKFVMERMQLLFPGSAGGFLVGLLAGGSRGMSRDVFEDVRATGLTHVIAVSGYNVTLVLNLVLGICVWLPRRWKMVPVVLFLILFVMFVGLSASAVRAAIMGCLTVFALSAGRTRAMHLALLWSAVAMVMWQPFMLIDDRGFQLSFLATIGVCYLAPHSTSLISRAAPAWLRTWILEPLLTTFAVYLATIPILFSFEQFSLIGLVTNVIFVPFIPFFMLLAVCTLTGSLLFLPLALFVGRLGVVLIDLYFFLLHLCAILPFSSIEVPSMSRFIIVGYYHLLVMFFWYAMRRSGSRRSHQAPSASR